MPRMTTRRWMIATAIVAMAIWGSTVWKRAHHCRAKTEYHAMKADALVDRALNPPPMMSLPPLAPLTRQEEREFEEYHRIFEARERARYFEEAEHHYRAKREFERAMWRFWESMPTILDE